MKAVECIKYGNADVLQLTETEKPEPKPNQVLVKILATTVTAADILMRESKSVVSRMVMGWKKPRKKLRIPGIEYAGIIEACGAEVQKFKPGDEVFGFSGFSAGCHAQYAVFDENSSISGKPAKLDFKQAVSLVDGSTTAFYFLVDRAKIKPGDKILVIGASGSIGSYAVQIARDLQTRVTGVCSGKNADFVRALGAGHVIDHEKEDFAKQGHKFDVIFDTVGKSSFKTCKPLLTEKGKYLVTTGNIIWYFIKSFLSGLSGGKRFVFGMSINKTEALTYIKNLAEKNRLTPVIDRIYDLEQIRDAHRYVEKGHKTGNVVISVNHVENRKNG